MKYIYIYIISLLFSVNILAQEDTITVSKPSKKEFNVSLGIDVLGPLVGLFDDRQSYSALINLQLYKKWFLQAQLGFEQNKYEDLGWISEIDGTFFRLGANYIITQGVEQPNNMFYVGVKFGYASFNQELLQVPIRADNQTTLYTSFPKETASAYWVELPVGARVELYKKLFAEAILQPMIYLGDETETGVQPVVIPAFGEDRSGINVNLFWGIVYVF